MYIKTKKKRERSLISALFILSFITLTINLFITIPTDFDTINPREGEEDIDQPKGAYTYPLWRFVSRIVDSYHGTQQVVGNPNYTLGIPEGGGKYAGGMQVFSLGGPGGTQNGFIIYAFDNFSTVPVIENGPGADFVIYENGFVMSGQPNEIGFWELVDVAVSTDGTNWARFSTWCDPSAPDPGPMSGSNRSYFSGVAGTWPVNVSESKPWADPAVQSLGGGDFFDLEDLTGHPAVLNSSVDLMNVNYIKVTDIISTIPIENGDIADNGVYWKDPTWGGADVDGAFIINYHILDADAPVLADGGEDDIVELGSTGNELYWNWTDTTPDDYVIFLGENIIDQGTWTSEVPITYPISANEVGLFSYKCVVNDSSGSESYDYINFKVEDTTAPNINTPPSDIYYNEGDTGNSLTWDWDDLDPNYYNITRDSTPIKFEAWNSSSEDITINVDGLSANTYTFRCSVNDSSGNWAYNEVDVIVSSDLSIFGPEDFSYTIGSEDNKIQWTATTGANPDGYNIYQDDVLNETGSWESGIPIIFDIDGLAVGEYEFNCSVKDDSGTSTFDLVTVTVEADTQDPSLVDASSNMEIDENESGIVLNWTWVDINPNEYIIKRNGEFMEGNVWQSGTEINYAIGSLSIGEYEFVCEVNDTHTNINNFMIQVNITDKINPELTDSTPNKEIVFLSTGNTINWTWTDLNPGHYKIYQDADLNSSGIWASDIPIILNIDGLDTGDYNYNCIVNDTYGNINNHIIEISVVDSVAPSFGAYGKSFKDQTLLGVITEYLFWCEWTDDNDFEVKLLLNSTEYLVSNVQNDNFSITLTNLDAGTYQYSWFAIDECYNSNYTMLNYNQSFEIIIERNAPIYSTPSTEIQDDDLVITVDIHDGNFSSGIQAVNLYYSVGDKNNWDYIQMDFVSSQIYNSQTGELSHTYEISLIVPNKDDIFYYYIEIYDNHGNLAESSIYEYGDGANDSDNKDDKQSEELGIHLPMLALIGGISLIGGVSIITVIRRRKPTR